MKLLDVVFIVIVVLKLIGLIAWSWWLILSPIWIGLALTALLYLIVKGVAHHD